MGEEGQGGSNGGRGQEHVPPDLVGLEEDVRLDVILFGEDDRTGVRGVGVGGGEGIGGEGNDDGETTSSGSEGEWRPEEGLSIGVRTIR